MRISLVACHTPLQSRSKTAAESSEWSKSAAARRRWSGRGRPGDHLGGGRCRETCKFRDKSHGPRRSGGLHVATVCRARQLLCDDIRDGPSCLSAMPGSAPTIRTWGHLTVCSKLHAKLKVQRFQQLSQSLVCARKRARPRFMGISVSQPSFKIVLKGKRDLERALACDFGQIVRRPQNRPNLVRVLVSYRAVLRGWAF